MLNGAGAQFLHQSVVQPVDRVNGPVEAVRVRVAASRDTSPALLAALAHDPVVTVRAAVALNPATPDCAEDTLASDPDDRVRALLGRRLAAMVPTRAPDALCAHVVQVLNLLVADEAVRVRAAIADIVKDMPGAPHALILRLVQDADIAVGGAVIELSPVLTNSDLIGLLTGPAHAAVCVARRPNLPAEVADAIAAQSDCDAVTALLANPSAQIREATLDALAATSAHQPQWHEPLVRRPVLSAHAVRTLSRFVGLSLLRVLAERPDLDPALVEELRRRLPHHASPRAVGETEDVMASARALAHQGRLDEPALMDAVQRGETREAAALLAVASGQAIASVDRATAMRSAKGLVSLVWRAGFTMRAGCAVQALLAQLGPGQMLSAGPGGSFPLAVEEMKWQVEFLGRKS